MFNIQYSYIRKLKLMTMSRNFGKMHFRNSYCKTDKKGKTENIKREIAFNTTYNNAIYV